MHTLSLPFIQRCVELGLVPCVERIMEARHAYVQDRIRIGKKKGVSASTCSLASGRMLELEKRMLYYPSFGQSLMQHTDEMRNPREALKKLELANHPRVAAFCNILHAHNVGPQSKLPHGSALWPGFRDIIYRLCGHDQYRSTEDVTKAQTVVMKAEAKLRQKVTKLTPPKRSLTREANVREAMSSHLLHECKSHGNGFMFSIRASTQPDSDFQVSMASLEDHIHTSLGNAIQRMPVIRAATNTRRGMDVEAALEDAFDDDLTPRSDDDLEVVHEQMDVHFKVRTMLNML